MAVRLRVVKYRAFAEGAVLRVNAICRRAFLRKQ